MQYNTRLSICIYWLSINKYGIITRNLKYNTKYMAFEKLNYTTEEKIDEESIQDKIDKWELDVMKLTRDNLQKLKVDILESSSYVKIRDHDGKIIWDLKDNNVVDFNGENISIDYKWKKKVFLGINFADWKKWYVSADYLKWEKIDSTSQISDNNGWKAEKTEKPNNKPQVLDTKKDGWEKWNEWNKKVEWTKKTDKIEATDTKESNNKSPRTLWYTKDGKNYIIWETWEAQLLTYEKLSPEYKKALEWYKNLLVSVENLNLLLTALIEKDPVNLQYKKELQDSINNFNPNNLELSIKDTEDTISNIFLMSDLKNKWVININNRISILTYIRDELDNYELVRKEIVESNFNKVTKLTEEQIQKLIKNPTLTSKEIENAIGKEEMKEIQDKLIEKKSEAEKYFLNYKDELKSQYPNLSENEIQDIVLNAFMWTVAKTYIMESYINQHESTSINGYNWKDTEIELFSDIQWIWAFDLSDKNWDLWYEAFKMIATEALALAAWALTAWAWALWVNALVYWARWFKWLEYLQKTASLASKSIEWLSAVEKSSVIWAKFARFAALSTVEWSAFYAWYGAVQSWAEGKNMYSWEWLAESIAFMWAFKWLNGLYKALWKELQVWVPLSQQKILLTSQLLAEWTTFSALWLWFDGKLLEPGEWTAETIVQAFLMAGLFKAGWRMMENMRIKRSGENDVVIEELASTSPVEFYKNNTTWDRYTRNIEWKFFNSKWQEISDTNIISSLEKIEVQNKELWTDWYIKSEQKVEFTKNEIDNNYSLSDKDRLVKAEQLIWRQLNDIEKQAILDAHNYETWTLRDKVTILSKNFNKKERELLLRSWICWKLEDFNIAIANKTTELTNIDNSIKTKNEDIDKINSSNINSRKITNLKKEIDEVKAIYWKNENELASAEDKTKYWLSGKAKNGEIIEKKEQELKDEIAKLKNNRIAKIQKEIDDLINKKTNLEKELEELSIQKKEFLEQQEELKRKVEEIKQERKNKQSTSENKWEEQQDNWTESSENSWENLSKSNEEKFKKILEKDLNNLKKWESINYREYKITYNWKEYHVEWPNNFKKDFLNKNDASNAIYEEIWNNLNKIETILKNWTKEVNNKLEILSKDNILSNKWFDVNWKTLRVKKDWDNFKLQEKNWSNWFKDLDLNTLNNAEVELVLEKILWKNVVWQLKNSVSKLTADNVFTKSEKDWIIKKYWKKTWEWIAWYTNDLLSGTKSILNLLRWVLGWWKDKVFWKYTVLWWLAVNEFYEYADDEENYSKNFFTWEHLGYSILNAMLFRQVWIIRWMIYNEYIIPNWMEYWEKNIPIAIDKTEEFIHNF